MKKSNITSTTKKLGRPKTRSNILSISEINRINGKKGGRPATMAKMVRDLTKEEQDKRRVASRAMNLAIIKRTEALVRAGFVVALGQNFIYRIDEEIDSKGKVTSRKHVLVEDPHEIAKALDIMDVGGVDPDEKYYYVTTKEPDHKAIEMLLNRTYGKPKESLDLTGDVKFSLKELAQRRKQLLDADYTEAETVPGPESIHESMDVLEGPKDVEITS